MRPPRLWHQLKHWRHSEEGVSAVEFALLAPLLFFGLLAMTDVGLALYERMTIDHVLRAGAQSAMEDQGEGAVLRVLEATAAKNFNPAGATDLTLSVARYHACADAPSKPVPPLTTCTGPTPTSIYYLLSAAGSYEGRILPRFAFAPAIQVQIR